MADLMTEAIAVLARRKPEEFFSNAGTPERVHELLEREIFEMHNLALLQLISEALDD